MKRPRARILLLNLLALIAVASAIWLATRPTPRTTPVAPLEAPQRTIELRGEPANALGTFDLRGARERAVEIEAGLLAYDPTIVITGRGTGAFLVELGNETTARHTFTSTVLGIDREMEPRGQDGFVIRPPREPGTYLFWCRYHADQGMRGAVEVR